MFTVQIWPAEEGGELLRQHYYIEGDPPEEAVSKYLQEIGFEKGTYTLKMKITNHLTGTSRTQTMLAKVD